MKKWKVGIDIDGVIWDLVTPWLAQYSDIIDEQIGLTDITEYDITKFVKSPETLWYILEMSCFWDNVNLYDGVRDAIKELIEDDRFEIYIVTKTSYKVAAAKFARLFKLIPELNEENIVVASNKGILDLDFLIDDYERNLLGILDKGVPILISQPYNEFFPEVQYGIIRKNNLPEAVDMIVNYIDLHILR